MIKVYKNISPARGALILLLTLGLGTCLKSLTGEGSRWARASVACCSYDNDMGRFPRRKSAYTSVGGTTYPGASLPIALLGMKLSGAADASETVPLPAPGSSASIDSFFDIFTEINLGSGTPTQHVDSFFDITYLVTGGGDPGGAEGTWPVEIQKLQISGQIQGPGGAIPILLRESPTQSSVGQYQFRRLPDDHYRFDSFFDIFTEISLDGGQNFVPAASSLRLELTSIAPEPGTLVLAALGLCGGLMARRRKR